MGKVGDTEGFRPRDKTMDTNIDILGLSGGGSEVREVQQPDIHNG